MFGVGLTLRVLFEHPTVEALAEAVRSGSGSHIAPIVPASRQEALPLSYAQHRLWVVDQLDPDNAQHNLPAAFRIGGDVDVRVFAKAVERLVERHEILRTHYELEGDHPVQVIANSAPVPLTIVDLSSLQPEEASVEAKRLAQLEAGKPFRLSQAPIYRAVLYRLAEDDHFLLFNVHHIASDGWSIGVLRRDLLALYAAELSGQKPALPELTIQYADYAKWQRETLTGDVLAAEVSHWRTQLQGAPLVLDLPGDHARPDGQTSGGARQTAHLAHDLSEKVRALGRQHAATVFMTAHAAFQALISFWSGQRDFLLGTDLANRPNTQTESLIGFFVNLVVLRCSLAGDPDFTEMVARSRETALAAYAHQELPFEKIVEELQPERTLSRHPVVQVLFVQQNAPQQEEAPGVLTVSPYAMEVPARFDLAVFVKETAGGLAQSWVYDPALFDAPTITRMIALYQTVLQTVTTNPQIRLSELIETLSAEVAHLRSAASDQFQNASLQKLKRVRSRGERSLQSS